MGQGDLHLSVKNKKAHGWYGKSVRAYNIRAYRLFSVPVPVNGNDNLKSTNKINGKEINVTIM